MKKLLVTTMFCGALAMPAFAQDETTTCAEFTEMDTTAQTEALASIEGAGSADVGTDSTASVEGSDDDTASGTASGDMAAEATDDTMDGTAAEAGTEVTASAVVDACANNPDMLVVDAIEQAKSN
ncbi:hypothetical protein [Chelativorans salis]|uniref:HdeA/HdeB family protein n=1 Tax=Chelativorans salis TaxID=2978478 RepID=A0ABT2LLZ0_9HYPH|nr:hypothetical protein [Chelativorans sp. EGI FJ00035]MCT7375399.1 hypothetical protein [Chelativorans sp. EGI FJ00035]